MCCYRICWLCSGGGVENGTISNIFPYLSEGYTCAPVVAGAIRITRLFSQIQFDLGAYGVSVFFLISGFVVSMSLENKSIKRFVVKRIFRIWPAYIAGFSGTFFMIWAYTKWSKAVFPYTIKDWAVQCSLLRDWLWVPCIDGSSWTLVAELKFYFVMCIIFYFQKAHDKSVLTYLAVAMGVFNFLTYFSLEYLLENYIYVYRVVYNLSFSNINILYMLLGVCIYNYYRKYLALEDLVKMLVTLYMLLCFSVIFSAERNQLQLYTVSYLFGLLTFLAAYVLRDKLSRIRILGRIGEISYPLYIVHGLNGYIIQTFLVQHHIHPLLCFAAAVGISTAAAYLLHITVEKNSISLSERLCKNL